jgi:hypothetical protein
MSAVKNCSDGPDLPRIHPFSGRLRATHKDWGFGPERIRLAVDCFRTEAEMSDHQREIYHSENGDRWLLNRDGDCRAFILHKANLSSGGKVTSIELGDFLGAGKAGPEHQALIGLTGSPVDKT